MSFLTPDIWILEYLRGSVKFKRVITNKLSKVQIAPAPYDYLDHCWLWPGPYTSGYGELTIEGVRVLAHRLMWELHNNSFVPDNYMVCHMCDVGRCINPTHLFIGTSKDNQIDACMKGRRSTAELSYEKAEEIRNIYKKGGMSERDLARSYNVHRSTINRILKGNAWRNE